MPVQELEGELRRMKNFWTSKKDTYKLKAHLLLLRKQNKAGFAEYKTKYDLSLYRVRLSAKPQDSFFLEPLSKALKKVEFRAMSSEDRARWFTAITKAQKENELESLTFLNRPSQVQRFSQVDLHKQPSNSPITLP